MSNIVRKYNNSVTLLYSNRISKSSNCNRRNTFKMCIMFTTVTKSYSKKKNYFGKMPYWGCYSTSTQEVLSAFAAVFLYTCCMLCLKAVSHHDSVLSFISPCVSVCMEWFSAASASALSRLYCVWKKMTKEQEAKQHKPAITSTGTVCVGINKRGK